ncbi:2,4-dihydroxyhept-2-ene-1,7-dioic acid aldolase [Aureobasidium pullulans]|nr:2,4-dihydroxyhept-2-ene-1,7-dioic acid aldolase [Aureobasidium pullulans]
MQAANHLHKALHSNTLSLGAWQMLPGSNLSRILARKGPTWICVDTEHGNISDSAMHESVAAIASCNVSPIVRTVSNEGWMIKRALDAGAHGIVIPQLNTAEEASAVVKAAKFPPQGIRGFGSPFAMERFVLKSGSGEPVSAAEYLQQANDALVTIIQIETQQALDNVDAIAAVPGVDVLFVGPYDLGNSIGYPILSEGMHDELKAAIEKIHAAAKKAGKHSGIYCTDGDQARHYADRGFTMISCMTDSLALGQGVSTALGRAKGSWGHAALQGVKQGASKIAGSTGGGGSGSGPY